MSRSLPAELSAEVPSPAVVLELLKPITWFPPMWAFLCGVVSSDAAFQGHWVALLAGVLLCGPLLCACSQAVNDWYDRHVDAINEPGRPIPSGRMPGRWGLYIALLWTALSLACAAALGGRLFAIAGAGVVLAWLYSAPPVRLKRNGWWGNLACAVSYEGFAWIAGATLLAAGWPSAKSLLVAALYSAGAHGIMTLNDFKSLQGDRDMGIASLPVQHGVAGAAWIACLAMGLAQVAVIVCLAIWGRPLYAAGVAAVLLLQVVLMRRFLADPRRHAVWYSGTGVPAFVSGMLISAFALRGVL